MQPIANYQQLSAHSHRNRRDVPIWSPRGLQLTKVFGDRFWKNRELVKELSRKAAVANGRGGQAVEAFAWKDMAVTRHGRV